MIEVKEFLEEVLVKLKSNGELIIGKIQMPFISMI